MDAREELVQALPGGYTASWVGLSYQERLGGMIAATALGIFLVPVLFVVIMRLASRAARQGKAATSTQ